MLLEIRLSDGLQLDVLTPAGAGRLPGLVQRDLILVGPGPSAAHPAGRLLADAVVRELVD